MNAAWRASRSKVVHAAWDISPRGLDLLVVLGWALGLRLLFALLTSGTYDADEFVLLGLSQSFAHGAVPYRDFMFFHPPGMLVLLRGVQPAIALWWPSARVLTLLADTGTAVLTWRIALVLYERRTALIAGLLYGASPLALVSGVRVGQDPLITLLGLAGLALLLTGQSHRRAALAGVCLALAIWIKYPALLFLPIYLLASPRRTPAIILSTGLASVFLFAPFASTGHALFQQTVQWQRTRPPVPLDLRAEHLATYWLLVNALAIPGLLVVRRPLWLMAGFAMGGAFILSPQVYYHYLVPVVPFAALLAAPLIARVPRLMRRALLPAALALIVAWALAVDFGSANVRLFATSSHFSEIRPVVQFLDRSTPPGVPVLSDRFEYVYLAHRLDSADYFWNAHNVVSAGYLERQLRTVRVVVVTDGITTYPDGFVDYLADHLYAKLDVGATDVWLQAAAPKGRGS